MSAPSRFAKYDVPTEVTTIAIMVYSLPRVIGETDALVVFPAFGEVWREKDAIEWWQNRRTTARFLLFAGENPNERAGTRRTIHRLQEEPFNLHRLKGVFTQIEAQNTKEQAQWVVQRVVEFGTESITLFVSPYHLLRAYLTLLKALKRRNIKIPIIPAPTPIAPNVVIPEFEVDAWKLAPAEIARIPRYQEQGDIATFNELTEYLTWLWEQPILLSKKPLIS